MLHVSSKSRLLFLPHGFQALYDAPCKGGVARTCSAFYQDGPTAQHMFSSFSPRFECVVVICSQMKPSCPRISLSRSSDALHRNTSSYDGTGAVRQYDYNFVTPHTSLCCVLIVWRSRTLIAPTSTFFRLSGLYRQLVVFLSECATAGPRSQLLWKGTGHV